jgi:N6-L-threonylcarbamoyladenine synthase
MDKDITILAIESSCDETSAAVVKNGREVLSNVISSQIATHKLYGGVVPEIASRQHIEAIDWVIDAALEEAKVDKHDVDAIAVTYGPGLVGALLVGLSEAKALAFALNKPLVPVHHIEGHIAANYIENINWKPPFICEVVSGGHTHLVHIKDYNDFDILGRTRDDAAGEAFDKVARVLGLTYPGGPQIDKLSNEGNPDAISFPRVVLEADTYDFSFSGLKSAVLNYINKAKMTGEEINNADVAASFQKAVTDVLVEKAMRACNEFGLKKLALAGGVSANKHLRAQMQAACDKNGIELCVPKPVLCTDNAAMIGAAGYYEFIKGVTANMDVNAYPSIKLGERAF